MAFEGDLMRALLLTGLLLAIGGCAGTFRPTRPHGPPPHGFEPGGPHGLAGAHGLDGPRGRPFLSPMGEPFHAAPGGASAEAQWFAGADTNRDGAITLAEFEADAMRFFAVLDRKQDGEIDPEDIDYYENVLAPEIRAGGGMGGEGRPGGGRRGGGGGHHGGGMRGGGMGGGGMGGGGMRGGGPGGGGPGDGGGQARSMAPARQGAARFTWLDYPEPVTAADRNFNRGVDRAEFQRAADERFALLDKDGDGRLTQGELPRLP
jgi:hypothetical protein